MLATPSAFLGGLRFGLGPSRNVSADIAQRQNTRQLCLLLTALNIVFDSSATTNHRLRYKNHHTPLCGTLLFRAVTAPTAVRPLDHKTRRVHTGKHGIAKMAITSSQTSTLNPHSRLETEPPALPAYTQAQTAQPKKLPRQPALSITPLPLTRCATSRTFCCRHATHSSSAPLSKMGKHGKNKDIAACTRTTHDDTRFVTASWSHHPFTFTPFFLSLNSRLFRLVLPSHRLVAA